MKLYLTYLLVLFAIYVCEAKVVSNKHHLTKGHHREHKSSGAEWKWLKSFYFESDESNKERDAMIRHAMAHFLGQNICTCEKHHDRHSKHKLHERKTTTTLSTTSSTSTSTTPTTTSTSTTPTTTSTSTTPTTTSTSTTPTTTSTSTTPTITSTSTTPTTTSASTTTISTTTTAGCIPSPLNSNCYSYGNCTGCLSGPFIFQTSCIKDEWVSIGSQPVPFTGKCRCSLGNGFGNPSICCDGSAWLSNGKCPPAVIGGICIITPIRLIPEYGRCATGSCQSDSRAAAAFGGDNRVGICK